MRRTPKLDTKLRKRLRQIAHHLDPVVTVGDHGVTDNLAIEVNRALADHELIKVRVSGSSRESRENVAEALAARGDADIVQQIGKMVILYRQNPNANVKLSNVQRYGA